MGTRQLPQPPCRPLVPCMLPGFMAGTLFFTVSTHYLYMYYHSCTTTLYMQAQVSAEVYAVAAICLLPDCLGKMCNAHGGFTLTLLQPVKSAQIRGLSCFGECREPFTTSRHHSLKCSSFCSMATSPYSCRSNTDADFRISLFESLRLACDDNRPAHIVNTFICAESTSTLQKTSNGFQVGLPRRCQAVKILKSDTKTAFRNCARGGAGVNQLTYR